MLTRLETRYSSRRTFDTYNGNHPLASAQVGRFKKKRAMGEAMDGLRHFDVAMLTVFVSKRSLRQSAADRDPFICNIKPYFKYGALYRQNTHALESVDAPEGGSVWEAAGQACGCMAAFPFPAQERRELCALVCVDGLPLRTKAPWLAVCSSALRGARDGVVTPAGANCSVRQRTRRRRAPAKSGVLRRAFGQIRGGIH